MVVCGFLVLYVCLAVSSFLLLGCLWFFVCLCTSFVGFFKIFIYFWFARLCVILFVCLLTKSNGEREMESVVCWGKGELAPSPTLGEYISLLE
jgi:hypothetical protein